MCETETRNKQATNKQATKGCNGRFDDQWNDGDDDQWNDGDGNDDDVMVMVMMMMMMMISGKTMRREGMS